MTKEQLYEAFGNINEKYVEAANKRRPKNYSWIKWMSVAACLGLVVAGMYCYKLEHPYPKKEVLLEQLKPSMEQGTEKSMYEVPVWEDLEIYAKYPEVAWNDVKFDVRAGRVGETQLGAHLVDSTANSMAETSVLTGEEVVRYYDITLYEIAGISTDCAVAVLYKDTDSYYAAVNSWYRPETLGQFISDLNLQEAASFGKAYYTYRKTFSGDYATVYFENISSEKIWEMLLAEQNAENVYSDKLLKEVQPKTLLDISINIPVLGYENISLSVMEKGYIKTNILDTGKLFNIGEKNTEAFIDYVLKECDGYEIVYTQETSDVENSASEQAMPTKAPVKYIIEEYEMEN